jgi:hypothetical protein
MQSMIITGETVNPLSSYKNDRQTVIGVAQV